MSIESGEPLPEDIGQNEKEQVSSETTEATETSEDVWRDDSHGYKPEFKDKTPWWEEHPENQGYSQSVANGVLVQVEPKNEGENIPHSWTVYPVTGLLTDQIEKKFEIGTGKAGHLLKQNFNTWRQANEYAKEIGADLKEAAGSAEANPVEKSSTDPWRENSKI